MRSCMPRRECRCHFLFDVTKFASHTRKKKRRWYSLVRCAGPIEYLFLFFLFVFAAEHWFRFHFLVREVHIINSLECRCCPIAHRPKVCALVCFYTHDFWNGCDSSIYVKCANKQAFRIAFLVWRWRFFLNIFMISSRIQDAKYRCLMRITML